jgi:hypothetical protein
MKPGKQEGKDLRNIVNEGTPVYASREALEDARLREAINRTDTEKFRLFTRMMRINMMMKRARIIHKQE